MKIDGKEKKILNLILKANPSVKIKLFHRSVRGASVALVRENAIHETSVLYVIQWSGDRDWFGQEGDAQNKVAGKMVKRLLETRKKFGLRIPEFGSYEELKMKYMLAGIGE